MSSGRKDSFAKFLQFRKQYDLTMEEAVDHAPRHRKEELRQPLQRIQIDYNNKDITAEQATSQARDLTRSIPPLRERSNAVTGELAPLQDTSARGRRSTREFLHDREEIDTAMSGITERVPSNRKRSVEKALGFIQMDYNNNDLGGEKAMELIRGIGDEFPVLSARRNAVVDSSGKLQKQNLNFEIKQEWRKRLNRGGIIGTDEALEHNMSMSHELEKDDATQRAGTANRILKRNDTNSG